MEGGPQGPRVEILTQVGRSGSGIRRQGEAEEKDENRQGHDLSEAPLHLHPLNTILVVERFLLPS